MTHTPPATADLTIALDGPAAAGKSTVGRAIADRLGLLYLDTGAIYRALTVAALDAGIPVGDAAALALLAASTPIDIVPDPAIETGFRVLAAGRDVTDHLRTLEVDRSVSTVSRHAAVRAALLPAQRAIARNHGIVMVGRDIGTVVLPDADLKIYLDASPEERARRRYRERLAHGEPVVWHEILEDVRQRDAKDSQRAVAPLARADDAAWVDTSELSASNVVDALVALAEEVARRLGGQGTDDA